MREISSVRVQSEFRYCHSLSCGNTVLPYYFVLPYNLRYLCPHKNSSLISRTSPAVAGYGWSFGIYWYIFCRKTSICSNARSIQVLLNTLDRRSRSVERRNSWRRFHSCWRSSLQVCKSLPVFWCLHRSRRCIYTGNEKIWFNTI